jgi:hypothetical protein
MKWTQAEPGEDPTKPEPSLDKQIIVLKDKTASCAAICENIEKRWIPDLEKELAELQRNVPPGPIPVVQDESTGVLSTSIVIDVISDIGSARGSVVAGSIITTRKGEALESLRAAHPGRHVIQVSIETFRARKAAGHVING